MNRRTFLAGAGGATLVTLAGCLGDGYSTREFHGQAVPLVPTEDAHEWYEADDALFVDTRQTELEFHQARIEDAVYSPAAEGLSEGDPLEGVDHARRIVTYCVCPHALAGSRAGVLIGQGYESVYALDEGLQDWYERRLPMEGTNIHGDLEAEYHD